MADLGSSLVSSSTSQIVPGSSMRYVGCSWLEVRARVFRTDDPTATPLSYTVSILSSHHTFPLEGKLTQQYWPSVQTSPDHHLPVAAAQEEHLLELYSAVDKQK